MVDQAKTLFEQADEIYYNAQEGLYKPEEDVVHYMVCHGAFKASYKFLSGYLINQNYEIKPKSSLEDLLKACQSIDKKFKTLNLEKFYHATEEEDVWMDIGTSQEFFELATQTRSLVLQNGD